MADAALHAYMQSVSASGSSRAAAPQPGLHYLSAYRPEALSPAAYEAAYSRLRAWIEASLDTFKAELRAVLFPLFEHCYMDLVEKGMVAEARAFFDAHRGDHADHADDLTHLECVATPEQLLENDYARTHRTHRCAVPMTPTTFQLLISYLEDNGFVSLLRILNTHVTIDVATSKSMHAAPGVYGLDEPLQQHNTAHRVCLGPNPIDPRVREQIEAALREAEKNEPDESKRKFVELFRAYRPEHSQDPPPLKPVPLPPVKAKEIQETVEVIRDMANRVHLSSTALPSCCYFTWHNTYDTLTCATITHDATLLAGGFSDSVVRVHSLTKDPLRAVVNPGLDLDAMEDMSPQQLDALREPEGSPVKRLVGHSGAVYGASFSPDKRYLVTCSEDATVRLWSMDTFTNLVCYRGHAYPVWDVDFAPTGHYFATSSHDRTARLWSTDHIYPLRIFAGHLSDVDCVKFHPNGAYLATGSADKTVRCWDVQRGHDVRVFTGHAGGVSALAFAPDGRLFASGGSGDDKYVYLWDISAGARIKRMSVAASTKSAAPVTSLAFSQEGNLLVAGLLDGSIKVWDARKVEDEALAETASVVDPTAAGSKKKRKRAVCNDLLETLYTRKTPVFHLQFTRRNLLLATGPLCPEM